MSAVPKKLTQLQLEKGLTKLSEWSLNSKKTEISRSFVFRDFVSGLAFSAKIAVHAEIQGHHPTIELSYGKVKVTLSTHDVKGLTKFDLDLAKSIDGLRA